ncbi:MAG: hypothetical protein MI743_04185 [Sneathiellales bacterium]|nr:hypothetical protein [Sneathiellales bacterium]
MNATASERDTQSEKTNNLRAIFEILSYLHEDAKLDGHDELAERLEFTMNYAERQLLMVKTAQTVPPVSTSSPSMPTPPSPGQ